MTPLEAIRDAGLVEPLALLGCFFAAVVLIYSVYLLVESVGQWAIKRLFDDWRIH